MSVSQIIALDARLSARMRVAERPGLLHSIFSFLAHSGDSWFWWPGMILLWLLAGSYWKVWALIVLLSTVGLAILVMIVKLSIRRQRPVGEWGTWYRATDPNSFPSGHAARAFQIAVLAIGLLPAWAAVVFSLWAVMVALARVAMGVHYLSDILAGSLLGVAVGLLVLQVV